jgi:hypothetical protein
MNNNRKSINLYALALVEVHYAVIIRRMDGVKVFYG